jgi:hypothetical protein
MILGNQPQQTYRMLFRAMTFVRLCKPFFFQQESNLIVHLISKIVPLTQHVLTEARACAVAFLLWLIKEEKEFHGESPRCTYAMMFALTSTLISEDSKFPFHAILPSDVQPVVRLCEQIMDARSIDGLWTNKTKSYFDIAREYGNFASIRAALYSHISNLCAKNNDLYSAFVAQWRGCALTANVFALRNEALDGLPPLGISSFPLVYDEPPVDHTAYGPHGFIALRGEIFTKDSWSEQMVRALAIVRDAKIGWIVSNVSSHFFNFLESRLDFSTLSTEYALVHGVFQDLAARNTLKMEFLRVQVGPGAQSKTHFADVVYLAYGGTGGFRDLLNKAKVPFSEDSEQPVPDNGVVLTRLHPFNIQDLRELRAKTFCADFIRHPDADWKKPYAVRDIHETQSFLPNFVPFSEIESSKMIEFTKTEYFIERLTKYWTAFKLIYDSYNAVLPRPKMVQFWASCALNLDTFPILSKIAKIAHADKEKKPHLFFVLSDHRHGLARPSTIPLELGKLSDEIWDTIQLAIPVVATIHETNPPKDEIRKMLTGLAETFRVTLPKPTDAHAGRDGGDRRSFI